VDLKSFFIASILQIFSQSPHLVQSALTFLLKIWNLEKKQRSAPKGQRFRHQNLRETNSVKIIAKKINKTQPDILKKVSWLGRKVEEKKP
jgi:hypothetical protein